MQLMVTGLRQERLRVEGQQFPVLVGGVGTTSGARHHGRVLALILPQLCGKEFVLLLADLGQLLPGFLQLSFFL